MGSGVTELTDIEADEVSPVRRGANRRRWSLLKSAEGTMELSRELADAVQVPHDNEGAMLDVLRKGGASEGAQEAALMIARLSKAFEDELPGECRVDVLKLGRQMYPGGNGDMEGRGASQDAMNDGDGDEDGDEDGDVDMAKRDFDRNVGGGVDRDKLPAEDFVDSEKRRFPIVEAKDVKDAVRSYGRANPNIPFARFKSRLTAIARRKGLASALPAEWKVEKGDRGDTMGEGITVPLPVKKEDGSWDLSAVPADARAFYEDVLKGQDSLRGENEKLREQVEKAEKAANAEREMRLEREFVAKAEKLGHVGAADELGAVLKAARETMSDELYGKLEATLSTAEERIAKGDLFREFGRASGGDARPATAWEQIEKAADEIVAKGELSKEQAIDRVLKTELGRRLYSQYAAENNNGPGVGIGERIVESRTVGVVS